jgi:hypothetical protein
VSFGNARSYRRPRAFPLARHPSQQAHLPRTRTDRRTARSRLPALPLTIGRIKIASFAKWVISVFFCQIGRGAWLSPVTSWDSERRCLPDGRPRLRGGSRQGVALRQTSCVLNAGTAW